MNIDERSTCRPSRPQQLLRQQLVARSFDMPKEIEHVQCVSTCRKDEKNCSTCAVKKLLTHCCQKRQHVERQHSTCRSNVRHVASTCCWCGQGFMHSTCTTTTGNMVQQLPVQFVCSNCTLSKFNKSVQIAYSAVLLLADSYCSLLCRATRSSL